MFARTLILGCGYTGARVALALAARGHSVLATSRDPGKLPLESDGLIELVRMGCARTRDC